MNQWSQYIITPCIPISTAILAVACIEKDIFALYISFDNVLNTLGLVLSTSSENAQARKSLGIKLESAPFAN
jgi:hypothetical protein